MRLESHVSNYMSVLEKVGKITILLLCIFKFEVFMGYPNSETTKPFRRG